MPRFQHEPSDLHHLRGVLPPPDTGPVSGAKGIALKTGIKRIANADPIDNDLALIPGRHVAPATLLTGGPLTLGVDPVLGGHICGLFRRALRGRRDRRGLRLDPSRATDPGRERSRAKTRPTLVAPSTYLCRE